jgi:GNAT superfamily N-acetyltransferase
MGVSLRLEVEEDFDFTAYLYATTRAEELAPVPWPETAKQEFLRTQCGLQRAHYRKHYAGAEFLIIEREETPIGRLYLSCGTSELRIMDIALLPKHCGQGLGSTLIQALLTHAGKLGISVTLHVEPANPAQRLYQRFGFRLVENRGIYDFLEWRAEADQLNTIS